MKKTLIIIAVIASALTGLNGQNKTELVIGNGAYRNNFAALVNPVPEAELMVGALEGLGFEVILGRNVQNIERFYALFEMFEARVRERGGIAMFHYGGHAVQVNGENYLLPTQGEIPDERRARTRGVNLTEVVSAMEAARAETNIIILDACRENPFGRGGTRGLARLDTPTNSIVVYSADSGQVARDGLFTPILLEYLTEPGLSLNQVLMQTRGEVYRRSNGGQMPGEYSMLINEVYLAGLPGGGSTGIGAAGGGPVHIPVQPEPGPVEDGLVYVEGGRFTMGSPESEANRGSDEARHEVTVSSFWMSPTEVTQGQWEAVMGSSPSRFTGNANRPVECVSWNEALEYCNALSLREGLTLVYGNIGGENPTVNPNANGYRLPTEAEWEYAARGGNRSQGYRYSGSNSVGRVGWYGDNSEGSAHPAGQRAGNELGLYDMSGNVWEWCWDRYGSYSTGSQRDPRGSSGGSYRF